MTRARRSALTLGLAVAIAWSTSGLAVAEESARIDEVGWWRSVGVSEPPEGGVAIGQGVGGPISVAALRVTVLADAPSVATLTLTESGGLGGEGAALQVCPTTDPWTSTSGGNLDDAPAPDCDGGSLPLARDDEGVWTGNVAPLLQAPSVSLMVVPAAAESEDPLAGPGAGFDLAFEAPSLLAPPLPGDGGATPDGSAPAPAAPAPSPHPDAAAPAPPPEVTSVAPPPEPFSPVPIDRGDAGQAPPDAATEAASDQVAIAPSTPLPTRLALTEGGGGRPWGQAVSYALLAAVFGTAAGAARWQLRERGLLDVA